MRLPCDVEIQNRMLPSHGMAKRGRTTRASLVIGRRPFTANKEAGIFLAVCTAKDRDGAKYSLKGNVVNIFGRFVQEGKATIRLQEPALDLCISKGDPLQLKTFLMAVNRAHRDQSLPDVQLSSLVAAKQSHVERPKTSVVISRQQDYPLTTGFPRVMESLQVHRCALRRVDKRILQAQNLRRLDLAHNRITEIPVELGELQHLSELILSDNRITVLPRALCTSRRLAASLRHLDLSHNAVSRPPAELAGLHGLVRLDLAHNDMTKLPPDLGDLHRLRFLNLSGNTALVCLPLSFSLLRLEELDLSGCPCLAQGGGGGEGNAPAPELIPPMDGWAVPSLLECAGRAVLVNKLPFQEGDIPTTLCFYLSPARWQRCLHGRPVNIEGAHGYYSAPFPLAHVAHTLTLSGAEPRRALAQGEGVLCSLACQSWAGASSSSSNLR